VRKAGKGAKCSSRRGTEICDVGAAPGFVCLDLGEYDADNMAGGENDSFGECFEICDAMNPCASKPDMTHNGVCTFGFFQSATLGICNDACTEFPNDCQGMGSPPAAGGTRRGQNCVSIRG